MVDLHRTRASWVTAGAVLVLVGTFLPWLRSGSAGRSSYELFDLVERLGFSPDGLAGWALRLWPLVPLLLVVAVVLQWVRHHHVALPAVRRGVTTVAGAYPAAVALTVRAAPETGVVVQPAVGTWVALAGGAAVVLGALWPVSWPVRTRESAAPGAA